MYLHTKNKLSESKLSNFRALETDRQTDRQTNRQTHTHMDRCDRTHYHAFFAGDKN